MSRAQSAIRFKLGIGTSLGTIKFHLGSVYLGESSISPEQTIHLHSLITIHRRRNKKYPSSRPLVPPMASEPIGRVMREQKTRNTDVCSG